MQLNFKFLKMNITKDITNKLMKRREISFIIESDKNPNFADMKKLIVDKFKAEENLIDVYNILGNFGSHLFTISADIYESYDDLIKTLNLRKSKKQKEADVKAKEEDENKNESVEEGKEEPREDSKVEVKEDNSDTLTDEVIEKK